ncbi:kelch repeat-containing protein [Planctomycetota bacterium]
MKKTILLVLVLGLGLATVSSAAEDTWTYKADMPTARGFVSGTVVDGKIYVIGGFPTHYSVTTAVEMYDPTADTWTRMANMPSARCAHATCTFDGKIYVFGGTNPDPYSTAKKNVYVYEPQTGTWTQKADMPYANALCGIAVVGDTIYLIGGTLSASSSPVSRLMAYDPATDLWTQKANMPTARGFLSACVVDGKIYAIGGSPRNYQSVCYKYVEVYDPSTDTWTRKSDMPTGRGAMGICVMEGQIYAVGGVTNGLVTVPLNQIYNPVTDTWTTKSPMQQRRLMPFVGSVGDKIYAIGGSYPNPQPVIVSTNEEYDTGLGVPSPDFNGDGIVDSADMCMMIDHWGEDYPPCDIGPPPWGDGIIDVQDLIVLAEHLFEEILPAELVAYWKLDETDGIIAEDRATENHGIVHGQASWQPESGKKAGALAFDGIDDYVETDFVLNPAGGTFSTFAWIKGGTPGQVILSQTDNQSGTGETWLGTDTSNGKLMTGLALLSGRTAPPPLVSETIITDGQWHHIGFVWDGSYRALYMDGIEVAKDSAAQTQLKSATGGLYIGAGKNLEVGTFFSGLIDDVRIYNVALSAEKIEALAH